MVFTTRVSTGKKTPKDFSAVVSYKAKRYEAEVTDTTRPRADSEKELLIRCKQGDQTAYRILVERHGPMLWRVVFRMTGSRTDAEDLSQEAFIKAFRSLSRFRGGSKFSTYLCSIVVNLTLNHIRRKRRREESLMETEPAASTACGISPRSAAESNEIRAILERELNALSPEFRAAVVLTAVEGMTHSEAAKILGCAENTVSWRVHEARKRLRHRLKVWRGNGE